MAELSRATAIGGDAPFVLAFPGCELRELPFVAKVRVQRMRGETAPLAADLRALLPETPSGVTGDDPWVVWRAPGDWLAVSVTRSARELEQSLRDRAAGASILLADVSSVLAVVELRGEAALEILARDCTLDLEGGVVPPGGSAQTMIAQVSVLIHRPGSGVWRLFVDRTAARYFRDWLVDSARLLLGGSEPG